MALICLRDQLGVGVLEWEVEQHGWTDINIAWAHGLACDLFGVCERDIEEELSLDDARFDFLKLMRDEADEYWARLGWEVTDGEGQQLRVMEYLGRPLLCAVKDLHADAKFTKADDAWAAQMEADAKRFSSGRGK